MKNSQASVRKHPVNNVEIVSAEIASEQLVNVIETTLTSNLKIPARHQSVKVFLPISVFESRWGKDNIHPSILAAAIHVGKRRIAATTGFPGRTLILGDASWPPSRPPD